jgi:hypothetical protein
MDHISSTLHSYPTLLIFHFKTIHMKTLSLLISLSLISFSTLAQSDLYDEEFTLTYSATKTGGKFLYNGKQHSFTIDVTSDKIKPTEYPNYITVGGQIIQAAIIAVPPSNIDLKNISRAQQNVILEGYVQYELDYFKKELNMNYQNFKKEVVFIDARPWLVWTFDVPEMNIEAAKKVKSQIYASTVCFNQVLTLNSPIMTGDDGAEAKKLLMKIMSSLKLHDKRM